MENRSNPATERSQRRSFFRILNLPVTHLQILLIAAIFFGGGGVAYGLRNLLIQIVALLVLALNSGLVLRFLREAPRPLMLLVIATMALPLLHAVFLPPDLWQALPGRDAAAESFAIAGLAPDRWFSLSVSPMRTVVAFCGTLAPATVIVVGHALDRESRLLLAWTVVGGSIAAFAWGAVQLSSGNTYGLLFNERTVPNVFYGTFANRNSTALFMVLSLCILFGMPVPKNRILIVAGAAAAALLATGTVLTQSRTGMVLLVIPMGLLLLRLALGLREQSADQTRKRFSIALVLGLATLVAGAVVVSASTGGRAADSFARFGTTMETDRPEMWEDGLYAADQYWPVGAGMGTFDDVFQMHESLEFVSPRRAGRAHNDYIELAIESGIPGLVLAALWLGWSAFMALRPGSQHNRWTRLASGAGVAAIALQSLLDYPLRNQTLLCVAAVLVVLLAKPRRAVT